MWFSQAKKIQQINPEPLLATLLSNGIGLSIEELIQYQSKSSLINLAASRSLHGKMSGNYLARSKGRGMEFDEVRHYQNGDDIRAIDWRVTARTGTTHTKLFREEIERPVLIATDLGSSMHFGSQLLFKSVQAGHLAALVAWHAKQRGDRIGGLVFDEHHHLELKPRSRQQGVLHYLHALVKTHSYHDVNADNQALQSNAQQTFEQNCARLRQLARPGSLVYLISDGYHLSEEAMRHLAHISRHCELVVCLIRDPLEQKLPECELKMSVAITDGINRQQLTLGDSKLAHDYQQQALNFSESISERLGKAGARLLHFSASESLETQLQRGVASWIR